ncbi:hypothetical protein [Paenibacillus agilis]|uniref:Copper amine oxidase-like N-terminal domain-containing protein n=1 Tax=Paenibacillus agilis TaxID=3020863 RepID=A0A559IPS1_9BACL|nr:hypothetical protein [Paenibacillus agilis]TVX89543.1 hypothetical protein FPZ44_17340 [Paenibacillus agilis]
MKVKRTTMRLVMGLLTAFVILTVGFDTKGEAAALPSKYVLSVVGQNISTSHVYVNDGKSYVSLRALTEKLQTKISYTKRSELYDYHQYEFSFNEERVMVWGNEHRGFWIQSRPVGQDIGPHDKKIYEPEQICVQESDVCKVDKKRYRGPILVKGTLYVPIREIAQALELEVTVKKTDGQTRIDLASA